MKRAKRDKTTRAYARGFLAGQQGRSKEICPHAETPTRHSWLSGWRDGRSELSTGHTGQCL